METNSWGCLVSFIVAVGVLAYLTDPADSKWWYAMNLGIKDDSQIVILKKPHDCEFMTAPVGSKHCHYDRVVQKTVWGTSTTHEPIVSTDGGKTWDQLMPNPGVIVPATQEVIAARISWNKVND